MTARDPRRLAFTQSAPPNFTAVRFDALGRARLQALVATKP